MTLELAMPILAAEEELKKEVPDHRVYDAILQATGDEETASKSLRERIAHRLRTGQKFQG